MPNAWFPALDSDGNVLYGLNTYIRILVYAYGNDTLLDKSYNEAYEILEQITNNDYQYPTTRVGTDRRAACTIELDAITSLTTHISSLINMIKIMKGLIVVQEMKAAELSCVYCNEDHAYEECPSNLAFAWEISSSTITLIPTPKI